MVCAVLAAILALQEPSVEELSRKAEQARLEGRDAEAIAGFKAVLERAGDRVDAHLGYQKVLQSLKREPELVEEYRALLEKHPEKALWYYLYGRLLHDPSREEELYRKGLGIEPDNVDLHEALTGVLWEQRRYEEAIAECKTVLRLRPDSVSQRLTYVSLMVDADRKDQLLTELRDRAAAKPDDFRAQLVWGAALVKVENPKEPPEGLLKARKTAPSDPDVMLVWCMHLVLAKKFDEARAALEEALRIAPHDSALLHGRGMLLLVTNEDGAEPLLKEAARLEPDRSDLAADLAVLYLLKKRFSDCEEQLKEALRLDRSNAAAVYRMGLLCREKGDDKGAVEWIEKAVKLEPLNAGYHQYLGQAYRKIGEHDRAREEMEKASTLENRWDFEMLPSEKGFRAADIAEMRAGRLCDLGKELLFAGRVAQAREKLQEALKTCPEMVDAAISLARIHQRLGEHERALEVYRKVLDQAEAQKNPRRAALASCRMADCLYDLGRMNEAEVLYRSTQEKYGAAISRREAGALEVIVKTLQTAPASAELVRMQDVRIGQCAREGYCFPHSLYAVLGHWKVDADVAALGRELGIGPEGGVTDGVVFRYLAGRKDLGFVHFVAEGGRLKDLLRRGFPVILFQRLANAQGESRGHATVAAGFDEARGLFLIEDANWPRGYDVIPYAQVEGLRALLVGPPALIEKEAGALPGQECCAKIVAAYEETDLSTRARLLREAAELRPDVSGLLVGLAQVYSALEDPISAIDWLEKGVRLKEADEEMWTTLGRLYFQVKKMEKAEKALLTAIKIDPDYWLAQASLAFLYHSAMGDPGRALPHYRRFVEIDPRHWWGHESSGCALSSLGRWDEAMREFSLAAAYGDRASSYRYLAWSHKTKNDLESAIRMMEKALERTTDPEDKKKIEETLKEWKK